MMSISDKKNSEVVDLSMNAQQQAQCATVSESFFLSLNPSKDRPDIDKLAYTKEHNIERPFSVISEPISESRNLFTDELELSVHHLDLELEPTKEPTPESTKKSNKSFQLQIKLDRLNISNKSHQKAIDNLPKLSIKLEKLNLKNYVKKYDSVKSEVKRFHNSIKSEAKIVDKGNNMYKCPRCSFKSQTFHGLSSHYSFHGGKLNFTFSCTDCDFVTKLPSRLNRHKEKHKKEADLSCPYCPYKTRFDCSLRGHLRRWHLPAHEAKTLNCTQCNFVSICKTTYEAHLMVHMKRGKTYLTRFMHCDNEEDVVKCKFCMFRTPNKVALQRHLQETHKVDGPLKNLLHRCNYCGFETRHRFSLQDHLLLHKDVEDADLLQCYHCGFKAKWKKYLLLHMRKDHPRGNQKKKKTVQYQCFECDKKFLFKYPLKVHILMKHRDPERLVCQYCTFSTIHKSGLKRHILVRHIDPIKKTYPCYLCSKISKDRATHRAHVRTHTFSCYMCNAELHSKSTLAAHMGTHMTKEEQRKRFKMFNCQFCDYETKNYGNFDRHLERWDHYPSKTRP